MFSFNRKFEIITEIILIALWFIIGVTTMFHHELWGDELRAFELTQESISDLLNFNIVNLDGHPVLWYLFLYPFAKLNISVFSMQIISLVLVFASVILLFLKSKFNLFLKIFISFSAGMIYFLPIIARNYALVPLFIFILACIYPKRMERPFLYSIILILTSLTHVYTWGLCSICAIIFLYEKIIAFFKSKNNKKFELIVLLLIFILYTSLILKSSFNIFYNSSWILESKSNLYLITNLHEVFNKLSNSINHFLDSIINSFGSMGLFFKIFAVIYFILLLKINKKTALILLFSYLYFFIICSFIYFGGIGYQKIYLLFIFLIFSYWISLSDAKIISSQAYKLLLISFNVIYFIIFFNPFFYEYIKDDIENKFTNTKDICSYLKHHEVKNDEVLLLISNEYDFRFYKNIYKFKINNTDNRINENINNIIKSNKNIKYIIIYEEFLKYIDVPYEFIEDVSVKQCKIIKPVYPIGINMILKLNREN